MKSEESVRTAFFAAGDFLAEEERFFFGISEVLLLLLLRVRSKFRQAMRAEKPRSALCASAAASTAVPCALRMQHGRAIGEAAGFGPGS